MEVKISTQLSIATIIFLSVAIFGALFVVNTSRAFDKLNIESQAHDEIIIALTDFRAASRQIIIETYQSLYLSEGKERLTFQTAIIAANDRLVKLLEVEKTYQLKNHLESELQLEFLKKNLDELVNKLTTIMDDNLARRFQQSKDEMLVLNEDYFKKTYLSEIVKISSAANKKNKDIQNRLNFAAERLADITTIGLIIVFLLSASVFIPLSFSLKRKVNRLMGYLNEFDFDNNRFPSIPQDGKDEFSHIGVRFNQLFTNLKLSKSQIDKQQRELMISSRMASLGEMSAGIAHEINNPLAVIVGNIHLLHKYIDSPEKLTAKVELLDRSCNRIIKIVNGLKKFSRSGLQTSYERKSLACILKESLILTEGKSKRHMTSVFFESVQDIFIDCDEIEIEQVLVNLINNSIDAVKDNEERWVRIYITVEEGLGVLRVIDSGYGIPDNIQEKIFDPFFTTKSVGQGTGLGLSITKGILEAHKATIAIVKDHPNTCFEIKFHKIENAAFEDNENSNAS